jgi:hypothetical protein
VRYKTMKGKILAMAAVILLMCVAILPYNAQAAGTTILNGTGSNTDTEPIVVTWVSGTGYVYTAPVGTSPATCTWTTTTPGAGTQTLVLAVKNTGANAYGVFAIADNTNLVTPSITAVWTAPGGTVTTGLPVNQSGISVTIPAGTTVNYTLTLTVPASAPLGTVTYAFNFSR